MEDKYKQLYIQGMIYEKVKDMSNQLNRDDYELIDKFMKDCKIPEGEGYKQILEGMIIYYKNINHLDLQKSLDRKNKLIEDANEFGPDIDTIIELEIIEEEIQELESIIEKETKEK